MTAGSRWTTTPPGRAREPLNNIWTPTRSTWLKSCAPLCEIEVEGRRLCERSTLPCRLELELVAWRLCRQAQRHGRPTEYPPRKSSGPCHEEATFLVER